MKGTVGKLELHLWEMQLRTQRTMLLQSPDTNMLSVTVTNIQTMYSIVQILQLLSLIHLVSNETDRKRHLPITHNWTLANDKNQHLPKCC